MEKNEVNIAFEILLEEIEEVFNFLSEDLKSSSEARDYEKAKQLSEYGEKLKSFREKVKCLQDEWQNLFDKNIYEPGGKRKFSGKLKKGLRTPVSEFIVPILEAIDSLGGKGKLKQILELIYQKMKDKLNKHDLEPLQSNPKMKRWKNTVQWTRYTLVKEGLISHDSPQGIWEITAKGKEYLNHLKNL